MSPTQTKGGAPVITRTLLGSKSGLGAPGIIVVLFRFFIAARERVQGRVQGRVYLGFRV